MHDVLEHMNGTLSVKHEGIFHLQFVGTFRRVEFQVEIVHLLEFFLVEELVLKQKCVKFGK